MSEEASVEPADPDEPEVMAHLDPASAPNSVDCCVAYLPDSN